ncbi:HlyD family secretion protein [Pseudomonas alkylphenolica]|uniref:HlyD family secretion protein n=1 Tax=Pseudomonas alkylphenolica TaxID=237609 RepID=A0A077FGF3_9PSED|nr:HlyD family secretion protein [Pseudomonas alkylphenolica]AIL62336.1 HlyD family secretion protein [Pseudomonas alkylphenolica]
MTPDQRFARWVKVGITVFGFVFVYFMVADLWMPLTPQAQLMRPVVRVAPQVSGLVVKVAVDNNAHVQAGQVLFRLDPEPFELAVDEAKLALEQAEQDNDELDSRLAAARAALLAAEANAVEQTRQAKRLHALIGRKLVSQQLFDQTETKRKMALADASAARSTVQELVVRRGQAGVNSLRVRQAQNALDQARLQLEYSQVRAVQAGVISNLQLTSGTYINAGTPVAALVADQTDITADFREKALRYVVPGTEATVVFDALPGMLFDARVTHVDAGVREGQLDPTGELAQPVKSDRWVRDAQRQRLHVKLEQPLPQNLPTGAKATVQLYPGGTPADVLGWVQIRLVGLLHYIY